MDLITQIEKQYYVLVIKYSTHYLEHLIETNTIVLVKV